MEYNFLYGDRLKKLRTDKNMTMDELSDAFYTFSKETEKDDNKTIRINKSMISRWENNISSPDNKHMAIYAKFFDIDINYLFGLSDIPTKLSKIEIDKSRMHLDLKIKNIINIIKNFDEDKLERIRLLLSKENLDNILNALDIILK